MGTRSGGIAQTSGDTPRGIGRSRAGPCSRCGAQGSVRLRKRPGRSVPYRTLPALPVPQEVAIPTCSRCRAEYLDAQTQEILAPLRSRLYAAELRRRIKEAIATLGTVTSQHYVETLLGLSQGYLSRLKAGAGTPSPALVLQLQQLALDPIPRLREAERLWGDPIPTSPQTDPGSRAGARRTGPLRSPPPLV